MDFRDYGLYPGRVEFNQNVQRNMKWQLCFVDSKYKNDPTLEGKGRGGGLFRIFFF